MYFFYLKFDTFDDNIWARTGLKVHKNKKQMKIVTKKVHSIVSDYLEKVFLYIHEEHKWHSSFLNDTKWDCCGLLFALRE